MCVRVQPLLHDRVPQMLSAAISRLPPAQQAALHDSLGALQGLIGARWRALSQASQMVS